MSKPSSSSRGDSAYTSAVSRSSVSRSSGAFRSTVSTRCRYQSAAARPTRLDVATRTRPRTRAGLSTATRIADDERYGDLAELGMGAADHAGVTNCRMHPQHRLHLVRIDVGSAPDDDVLDPTDDVQES